MQFKVIVTFLGAEEYTSKSTGNVSHSFQILSDRKVYRVACSKEQYDVVKGYDEGSKVSLELALNKYEDRITLKAIAV